MYIYIYKYIYMCGTISGHYLNGKCSTWGSQWLSVGLDRAQWAQSGSIGLNGAQWGSIGLNGAQSGSKNS